MVKCAYNPIITSNNKTLIQDKKKKTSNEIAQPEGGQSVIYLAKSIYSFWDCFEKKKSFFHFSVSETDESLIIILIPQNASKKQKEEHCFWLTHIGAHLHTYTHTLTHTQYKASEKTWTKYFSTTHFFTLLWWNLLFLCIMPS